MEEELRRQRQRQRKRRTKVSRGRVISRASLKEGGVELGEREIVADAEGGESVVNDWEVGAGMVVTTIPSSIQTPLPWLQHLRFG